MGRFVFETFHGRDEKKMVTAVARHLGKVILALLLFLAVSRLWQLGEKPYHHDEGIYSTLSWRFSKGLDYKFHPMTHGPFLFTLQGLMFKLLPINDFTGRLPVALAGILFPLVALVLLRKKMPSVSLGWLALCVFSPSFCYFSRFLGMDALLLVQATAFLAFGLLWWETKKNAHLYFASVFLGLLLCTKLNWLFYLFSFSTFLFFSGDYKPLARELWSRRKSSITSIGIVVFTFCLLYSTLGTHLPGIWDGLFEKMIPYWMNQHQIQRIAGPFHFYLTLIAIYEIPVVIGMIYVIKRLLSDTGSRKIIVTVVAPTAILWSVCAHFWPAWQSPFNQYLHMNQSWHPSLLLLEISLGLACLRYHLTRGEKLEAFFSYWMFSSLIIYSYAGEKIPWLLPHIILPAYLYLSTWLKPFSQQWKYAALCVVLGWQAFNLVRASFVYPSNPRERLVYTHTTQPYLDLIHRMDLERSRSADFSVQIIGDSDAVWPSAWYLRDYQNWFRPNLALNDMPHVIMTNWDKRQELQPRLIAPYRIEQVPLRSWWVPDPAQYTWKNFLLYFVARKNFNPTGSSDIAVFIREDALR